MKTSSKKISHMTKIAACTAILAIMALIIIPIGTVPFSMAVFGVFLISLLLSPTDACVVVLLYLLLGMVGVPIFSNFSAGPQVLIGPTGGYLIGYFCIAFTTAFFGRKCTKSWQIYIFMVLGLLGCYAFGTIWLMVHTTKSFTAALLVGVVPFIIPDLIKAFLALFIARKFPQFLLKGKYNE